MQFSAISNILRQKSVSCLSGEDAHRKMAPEHRFENYTFEPYFPRESAVLLLLYEDNKEANIVFIRRNTYKGHHSGQVCFPGGKKEPKDETIITTALRETKEELGVNTEDIEIIDSLSPLIIPVSNFIVHPFVGITTNTPVFTPNHYEVKEVITFPIKELCDPKRIKNTKMIIFEKEVNVPYFDINKNIVWGATAMILNEFIAIISK